MCGITGIISRTDQEPDKELLRQMNDIIAHRGPDGEGFYHEGRVSLAHRRLSIIDLSDDGKQPMQYGDRYQLVYNGEIYNYIELREELSSLGYTFQSKTDSEVIPAAYDAWGVGCLNRFNGMWSFALYDRSNSTVFMSRDRFGIKPFYYVDNESMFAFGSEIKQLLLTLGDEIYADRDILVESMLTHVDNHTDRTYFEQVKSLLPGHYMLFDVRSSRYTLNRYYTLETNPEIASMTLDEATKAFRDLFESSVTLRLRSDVTVGTCLSGGLDSSAVTAYSADAYKTRSGQPFTGIHAKSIDSISDESEYALQVSDHLGLNMSVVEPGTKDFIEHIDEVMYTQEEPFGSPSQFMGYFVFEKAKQSGCTVMLNGQGGDEILLGYERYFTSILANQTPAGFVRALKNRRKHSNQSLSQLLMYYLYFRSASIRSRRLISKSYLKDDIKRSFDFAYLKQSAKTFAKVREMQKFEITVLQLPHLLRYEDKNSMRHSVETRLPFLDFRVVEFALSIHHEFKIRDGWTKYILRSILKGMLPDAVVWRKSKFGFESPERIWLGAIRDQMIDAIRHSAILQQITDHDRLIRDFASLSLKDQWKYFSVAVWERVYKVKLRSAT